MSEFTSDRAQHSRGRMEEKCQHHQAHSLGVSLVSLARVQLRSVLAFCFLVRKQSLTDQLSDTAVFYLLVEHEFSSTRRRPNASPVFFFLYGSRVLTSTSEHKESWEQLSGRAFNVTSSVGTRGSSSVHCNSNWEDKK